MYRVAQVQICGRIELYLACKHIVESKLGAILVATLCQIVVTLDKAAKAICY